MTLYIDWSTLPKSTYRTCSPNLLALRKYLQATYGGENLGCYNDRPIRGGTKPSPHAYGAALDFRLPDREKTLHGINFLITNADALGIQSIHDYLASRIWHIGRGWKAQPANPRSGMGQSWADYIHIETTPEAWSNSTPIVDRLKTRASHFSEQNKPSISQGTRGPLVSYLQEVLNKYANQKYVEIDGIFGPKTHWAVVTLQKFLGMKPDNGIVNSEVWGVVDWLYKANNG